MKLIVLMALISAIILFSTLIVKAQGIGIYIPGPVVNPVIKSITPSALVFHNDSYQNMTVVVYNNATYNGTIGFVSVCGSTHFGFRQYAANIKAKGTATLAIPTNYDPFTQTASEQTINCNFTVADSYSLVDTYYYKGECSGNCTSFNKTYTTAPFTVVILPLTTTTLPTSLSTIPTTIPAQPSQNNTDNTPLYFILLIILIGIIVYFAKFRNKSSGRADRTEEKEMNTDEEDAIKVLKKRYAKGELTKKQYDQMRKDLE